MRSDDCWPRHMLRNVPMTDTTISNILKSSMAEYHLERDTPDVERGAREAVRGMMVRLGLYDDFCETKRSTTEEPTDG